MADGKITLEIVTPRGAALREVVDEVAAPSVGGQFGVLPGHLPIVTALATGVVTYRKGGEEKRLGVAGGFVEVKGNHVLMLTDKVAQPGEIDPVPVRLELKEVEQKLAEYVGAPQSAEWLELVSRELWAALQLELSGDPPFATHHPYAESGRPPRPQTPRPRWCRTASGPRRQAELARSEFPGLE